MESIRGVSVLAAVILSAGLGTQPAVGAPFEERVQVRRVHWPVLLAARADRDVGERESVDPSWIEVSEDGSPATVVAVERHPLPVLHALLLDTSGSMRSRLDRIREAATRYVDRMAAGESALVASFSDGLVLECPPTDDRRILRDAIARVRSGHETALFDALRDVIEFLASRPEMKILVLLSDGEDNASLPDTPFERVLEASAAIPDLAIFPVGIDLPRAADPEAMAARGRLTSLARETGGEILDVRRIEDLPAAFESLRDTLDRRWYVSYVPRPFGQGPLDEALRRASRRRQVRVRAARGAPCRVTPLGPPTRLESAPPGPRDVLEELPVLPADRQWLETALVPGRAAEEASPILIKMGFRSAERWADLPAREGRLFAIDGPRRLVFRASDIVLERGALYASRRGEADPARIQVGDAWAERERALVLPVPPLAEILAAPGEPADALESALRASDGLPVAPGASGWEADRRVVHGRTALRLRRSVGLALFRLFEDYRSWASQRIAEQEAAAVARQRAAGSEGRGLSEKEIDALRTALVARAAEPGDDQPQRFLADWLGDVPAVSAAAEIDRRAAQAAIGAPPARAETERRRIEDDWPRLLRWFPAPSAVRVVAPLAWVHRRDRGVIGFYRFLLPRPSDAGPSDELLPETPRGTFAAGWLRRGMDAAGFVADSLRVDAVRYGRVSPRDSRRLRRECLAPGDSRPIVETTLLLSRSGARAGVSFRLVPARPGSGPEDGAILSADVVERSPPDSVSRGFAEEIGAVLRDSVPFCHR